MSSNEEFDIIFAGGGTSGCVAAGRLAAANPDLRILIIEAGEHTLNKPDHVQPSRWSNNVKPDSKTATRHISKASDAVNGRNVVVSSGHCLGGGSSINVMMYNRAVGSDFDDWKDKYNNPGWGIDDLLPMFKKCETYEVKPDLPTHGYSGPLKVSVAPDFRNLADHFLKVSQEYDTQRGLSDDLSDLATVNKYGPCPRWISSETGKRSDVAHNYIYNQATNKNLKVVEGHRVNKVLLSGNKASGVEYVKDSAIHPEGDQTVHVAHASKLVVVSSGAFGSPAILERSGIGSREILGKYGIDVLVDLPGVGANYRDHYVVGSLFLANEEADTIDLVVRFSEEEEKYREQWETHGNGPLAHTGIDSGGKIRPTAEEIESIGPEFKKHWESKFSNAPDKPVVWQGPFTFLVGGDPAVVGKQRFYFIMSILMYPASIGSVHTSSANDPNSPEDFDCGYLTHPADIPILRWAYKRSRELGRRLDFALAEAPIPAPKYGKDSKAQSSQQEKIPAPTTAANITYSPDDDAAIDEFIKDTVATCWHSLGTCAMKPRDSNGVVDCRLNVYGVSNLKVADLSIAPDNVGANTNSTAIVIGEKAAALIAEDLGLNIL